MSSPPQGVDTASSFYRHMRQTFASENGGLNPTSSGYSASSVADIRTRLNQIVQKGNHPPGSHTLPPHPAAGGQTLATVMHPNYTNSMNNINPNRQSPPQQPQRPTAGYGAQGQTSPQPTPTASAYTPSQPNFYHAPAQNQPQAAPSAPAAPLDTEDLLTSQEMECLRVVELDAHVAVSASVPSGSNPNEAQPPLQSLCDSAVVKIFPKHVVFSRSVNGSSVVELVIAELSELSEDTSRGALTFVLQKPTGSVIIEITCRNQIALSALYKMVCSKKNMIESGASR